MMSRFHDPMSLVVGVLLAGAEMANAQSGLAAGSKNFTAHRVVVAHAGGDAGATQSSLRALVGLPTSTTKAESTSYRLEGAPIFPTQTPNAPPLAFGVDPGKATKAGGTPVTVLGAHFQLGGGLQVFFDEVPATITGPATHVGVPVLTPSGQVSGTPKGRIDVRAQNSLGSSTATDAFIYAPALTLDRPLIAGCPTRLTIHSAVPVFTSVLVLGLPLPNPGLVIGGIEGHLLVFPNVLTFLPLVAQDELALDAVVPADVPIGMAFGAQAIVLPAFPGTAPSVTNPLTLTVGA